MVSYMWLYTYLRTYLEQKITIMQLLVAMLTFYSKESIYIWFCNSPDRLNYARTT